MKGRSRVGQPGARTKTLGEMLAGRRNELGNSQKERAALIKKRDGKPITSAYLNYLEHNRGEPPGYLLDQFAEVLRLERDVLYFWTRRIPPDLGGLAAVVNLHQKTTKPAVQLSQGEPGPAPHLAAGRRVSIQF